MHGFQRTHIHRVYWSNTYHLCMSVLIIYEHHVPDRSERSTRWIVVRQHTPVMYGQYQILILPVGHHPINSLGIQWWYTCVCVCVCCDQVQ